MDLKKELMKQFREYLRNFDENTKNVAEELGYLDKNNLPMQDIVNDFISNHAIIITSILPNVKYVVWYLRNNVNPYSAADLRSPFFMWDVATEILNQAFTYNGDYNNLYVHDIQSLMDAVDKELE